MATEKFKMSYTVSQSGYLNNGSMSSTGKLYQRETIFGKLGEALAVIPIKSLSFANGDTTVTTEKEGVIYTVTLQNKDLIIEAEIVEDNAALDVQASLSDIFHSLPTVYDENGNAVDPDTKFITATGEGISYISIPNMATKDPIS